MVNIRVCKINGCKQNLLMMLTSFFISLCQNVFFTFCFAVLNIYVELSLIKAIHQPFIFKTWTSTTLCLTPAFIFFISSKITKTKTTTKNVAREPHKTFSHKAATVFFVFCYAIRIVAGLN